MIKFCDVKVSKAQTDMPADKQTVGADSITSNPDAEGSKKQLHFMPTLYQENG